eukprot:Gregarina_sp_Pseudo_9__5681@NODE_807_length_2191_cov_101_134294_g758_i0_p1_GENE_NODE_807_length_2191_cov_101_134294_g758_i0NODE_807_length_2191_cov_101_134294_g758_i0_p1_ORF_typecomplete_len568_score175_29TPP_enzyme_N/PF02776_18/5_1e41TPP_enzyme_C/PF02775_21/2_1e03TPP_enzyme_C/PF02775_21/5_6e03TPP_enzyme_C/PF02775_21/2_6e29TPP_enzyme_M/PF00205_22/2_1e17Transketolase_N/PF00456_21/0_013OCC1/PF15506_6/0_52_NODE_807_length_2191_cov_101_134294_g758_i01341837
MMVKLGDFLCQRLHEVGVHDLFGVPGDFSLGLLNSVVASSIRYVGTCNELNAAYAADGYARIRGIGACATTYAVGELSAINGVAGSFAESVPVVCLVGCPARKFYTDMPLLHHTLGDYHIPLKMYSFITCAQTVLRDPATAALEIDRVLAECLRQKKPVYIGVPSDMVNMDVEVPDAMAVWRAPALPVSDPDILSEAVDEIIGKIASARQPLLIPGVELIRRNLTGQFGDLLAKSRIPYVTMLLSKSMINEDNDLFIGLYSGNRSRTEVKRYVDESDCILLFGEKLTDFNTGGFTAVFNPRTRIYVGFDHVHVSSHTYNGVYIHDLLAALTERVKTFEDIAYPRAKHGCIHRRTSQDSDAGDDDDLTMHKFFRRMALYLPQDSIVMAETGASLFSAAETMMPLNTIFIGQTFYGSIGYTVGGCLGASIAAQGSNRRVFLFVGDGSFQVTAQDLSTMIRYKCNPVIFLVNNDGYTIERVITDNIYNDIQPWKYSDLPKVFGGEQGTICQTHGELEKALMVTECEKDRLQFIEIILDRWDCNDLLKNAGRVMAKNNNLLLSPVVSPSNR